MYCSKFTNVEWEEDGSKELNGGNEIMEVLIVVGFVAFIVWVIKEWAFYTRMDGQSKRIIEDNSSRIMDDIHKRK